MSVAPAASQYYIEHSQETETIDCVMYRVGSTATLSEVLALNPNLCTLPAVLPYNTPIKLPYNQTTPNQTRTQVRATVQLWS